jgi:hypothetical protein
MPANQLSILIIGATGKTGVAVARRLGRAASSNNKDNLRLHAMARSPEKVVTTGKDAVKYDSVIKGNAREAADIEKALLQTRATWIIISVGNGLDVSQKNADIRTANAVAVATVLQKPQSAHVRVLVVSSTGAGTSKMNIGFGLGQLVAFHLRHVLRDHSGQEAALLHTLGSHRVTIVRATSLTDEAPTGELLLFGDMDRCPTIKTNRADLADWIANEICGVTPKFPNGGAANVTSRPSKKVF